MQVVGRTSESAKCLRMVLNEQFIDRHLHYRPRRFVCKAVSAYQRDLRKLRKLRNIFLEQS